MLTAAQGDNKENAEPNRAMDDSLDSYPSTVTTSTARDEDPASPSIVGDYDDFDDGLANGVHFGGGGRQQHDGSGAASAAAAAAPVQRRRRSAGQGRFVCATCGKHLSSKHALALHERTVHQGHRDHPCALCPHQAKQSSNLQRHTWAHHCPDRLMEKFKEGLGEAAAKTVSPARLWREAVDPVFDKLWKQLSAKNQRDLQAQRNHFGLLAKTAELLGLDDPVGEDLDNKQRSSPPLKEVPQAPVPREELSALSATDRVDESASSGQDLKPPELGSKKPRRDNPTGLRPCLTCQSQHDADRFHPLVALMTAASPNDKTSHRCVRCRDSVFCCRDPLLLAVHQASVHGVRPALRCPSCPAVFDSPTELALHRWRRHGQPCPFCPPDQHTSDDDDDRHLTDRSRALVCALCADGVFVSSDRLGLALHLLERHTDEALWKACCSLCPARFLRKEDWNEHVRSAHHDALPKELKMQRM